MFRLDFIKHIGNQAGVTNQASNSIVINATGIALGNTVANTCVVKPLRSVMGGLPSGFTQVAWNSTTGELIAYSS